MPTREKPGQDCCQHSHVMALVIIFICFVRYYDETVVVVVVVVVSSSSTRVDFMCGGSDGSSFL